MRWCWLSERNRWNGRCFIIVLLDGYSRRVSRPYSRPVSVEHGPVKSILIVIQSFNLFSFFSSASIWCVCADDRPTTRPLPFFAIIDSRIYENRVRNAMLPKKRKTLKREPDSSKTSNPTECERWKKRRRPWYRWRIKIWWSRNEQTKSEIQSTKLYNSWTFKRKIMSQSSDRLFLDGGDGRVWIPDDFYPLLVK